MHPKKRGAVIATSAKSINLNSTQLNEAQVITSATTSTSATSVITATAPAAAATIGTASGNVGSSGTPTASLYGKYFCCM